MDPDIRSWFERFGFPKDPVPPGLTMTFVRREGTLFARLHSPDGDEIERPLRPLADLFAADAPEPVLEVDPDRYLSLLQSIEIAIVEFDSEHPGATDGKVLRVLDGLIERLEEEALGPMRTRIQDRLRLELSLRDWTRAEVLACLNKVRKSVKLHRSSGGERGYLDFIRGYV